LSTKALNFSERPFSHMAIAPTVATKLLFEVINLGILFKKDYQHEIL